MSDRLTPERRSWNMSRIRGQDTTPERRLRSLLHNAGFRFRLHDKSLVGRPDIVLPRYNSVIFVHGCFWHRHSGCPNATVPNTRTDFWLQKFQGTIERDDRSVRELTKQGWNVIIVWECELERNPGAVLEAVRDNLMEVIR